MTRGLLVLALFLLSPPVLGQSCPVIEGGAAALGESDPGQRIEFVRHSLLDDERRAKVWWIGWLTFLSAAELAQLALVTAGAVAPLPPPERAYNFDRFLVTTIRADLPGLVAGSITALGGIASLAFTQERAPFDGTAFDLQLKTAPLADPCSLLASGERMLLRDALEQRGGRAPLAHILNAAVNLASSLVIGIFFHQWVSAAVDFALGFGMGEVLVLTEPTGAETALEQYRRGDLSPPPPPRVAFEWHGLSGGLRF